MKKSKKFFIGLLVIGAWIALSGKSWAEEKIPVKEAELTPIEKQKEPSELKTEPAVEKKLVGCVAPIKDLVKTYQKELNALEKLIEKWNNRLQSAMQRETLLSKEVRSLEIEYDKKMDSEDKREKKEAGRMKGQLERLNKEQKILKKEMLKQCKELSAELGEFGKGSSTAIAEQIRQIQQEIGESLKEE